MLPGSCGVDGWTMSMVNAPEGDDHAAADAAGEPGPGCPGRAGTPLPHHPRRPHPHPLPAWVGGRAGPGGRPGPPPGRGGQRAVELSAVGRLPAPGDRPRYGDRDRQAGAAPGRVRVQAAPLGPDSQGPGPAGVGKKRLRVGALLGAASSPVPPPAYQLVPDATLDWELAEGRRAVPFCDQLRRAVARSQARGKIAMVILDNLGIHTPKGSRLLRGLLAELGEELVLVYTPTYDPDANRIEWLWRALRRRGTPTPPRQTLVELVADAGRWAHTITPAQVLSQIGSPFAPDQQPPVGE